MNVCKRNMGVIVGVCGSVLLAGAILHLIVSVNGSFPIYPSKPSPHLRVNINKQTNTGDCGGVLKETIGTISYKFMEAVKPHQRCVWILQATDATRYNIQTGSFGVDAMDYRYHLSFTGLRYGTVDNVLQKLYVVPTTSASNYTLNADVVIVTFHTTNIGFGYNGFRLRFRAILDNEGVIQRRTAHANSSAFVIDPLLPGFLKYPPHSGNYAPYELSFFVFTPANHTFNKEVLLMINLQLDNIELDCADRFLVYYYDAGNGDFGISCWRYLYTVCERGAPVTIPVTSTDSVLIIFRSDSSLELPGFSVNWRTYA